MDKMNPYSICKKDSPQAIKLKLLIMSQKEAIEDLEQNCEILHEMNQQLARDIDNNDRHVTSCARELQIRHEKLWTSLDNLRQRSNKQCMQAKAELDNAVKEGENQLSGLHEQLEALKAEVDKTKADYHTLKTYMDREYPVKTLKIATLEKQLHQIKQVQQVEHEDMHRLFQNEMVRLQRQFYQGRQKVLYTAGKRSVSKLPPDARKIYAHNHTMKREINMQKKEVKELEEENRKLLKSLQELRLSRLRNKNVYQDVFLKSVICTPDMDVHLNPARKDQLPI